MTTINQIKIAIVSSVAIILLVLVLILNPFVIITAGHRGVIQTWGAVSDKVLTEGIHWRTPIAQSVIKVDVRTVKYEVDAAAYSKDIQTVDAKLALNYHLNPDKVNKIIQEIGSDYESRIINPMIQESLKSVAAKFTAQELIEKRESVKDEIKAGLGERLSARNITVDELSIVNFDFSSQYEKAVEEKQVAQQDALTAKNKLEQVKFEADQRVAQAEAEAKAIQIQAQAITQQGGEDYVNLKWIEAWEKGGSKVPTTIIGEDGGSFLFNIDTQSK